MVLECFVCDDYKIGIKQISDQAIFCSNHSGGPKYTYKEIKWCPWCGFLLNKKLDIDIKEILLNEKEEEK